MMESKYLSIQKASSFILENTYQPVEDYPNLSGKFFRWKIFCWILSSICLYNTSSQRWLWSEDLPSKHMNSFNTDKNSRYLSFKLFPLKVTE